MIKSFEFMEILLGSIFQFNPRMRHGFEEQFLQNIHATTSSTRMENPFYLSFSHNVVINTNYIAIVEMLQKYGNLKVS